MKIKLAAYFLLILITAGCQSQEMAEQPVDFDYGHIENGKYVNSYFDFEITVPSDWSVQSKDEMEDVKKLGSELASGDDANMKATLKASAINTANLLMVYKYERGAAVAFNPSIVIVAENISKYPGIKNGSDYLFQSRKILSSSQFKYDYLDEEFEKEMIGGAEFYKMDAGVNYAGVEIKQMYYATITKSFSFTVILSYADEQQKNELLNTLNSMKFGK